MTSVAASRADLSPSALTRRVAIGDLVGLVTLIALGSLAPALLAAAVGLVDVPRNDDWSYRSISDGLFSTGSFAMDGASQSFAVGQVLLTQPLLWVSGGTSVAYWLFGTLASAVAVGVGFVLARSLLSRFDAVLVTAALVVAPGYLAYSSSYMTDVPALALQLLCLCVGVRAMRGGRVETRWAMAAILVGVVAFSVRQFAIVAPVSVAIAAIVVNPRERAGWMLAALGAFAVALLVVWQTTLGGQVGATPTLEDGITRAVSLVPTAALFLLPVSIRALMVRGGSRGPLPLLVGAVAAVVVLVSAIARGYSTLTVGNLMSLFGVPAEAYVIGGRPQVMGTEMWLVVQATALIGVVLLGAAIVCMADDWFRRSSHGHQPGSIDPRVLMIGAFVALLIAGLIFYATRWNVFDRYLWPLLIPAGILLLRRQSGDPAFEPPRPRRAAARGPMIATLGLAAVAAMYALNSYAFDQARWSAGERLVELGVPASAIDAGYEWVGTFAPGPAQVSDWQTRPPHPLTWYGNIWPELQRCGVVAGSPLELDGFRRLDTESEGYRLYLYGGTAVSLYLYHSTDPSCRLGSALAGGPSE